MKLTNAALMVIALFSTAAQGYPSMIRHGYTQCATCHVDPSGATLLTKYGRAQSKFLLSTRWGSGKEDEPAKFDQFLFGLVPLPDFLNLGGWARYGYLWNTVNGKLVDNRLLQMRLDLAAAVRIGPVRAAAQLGYASPSSAPFTQLAWVTRNAGWGNLVSREHWIGFAFDNDSGLVRGGRIFLPFGLRNIEHTSFVRTATRTDINQDAQDGIAVAISKEKWRMEVMAILGNYSLRPDAFRERGLAGYFEIAPLSRLAVGLSAFATRADAALGSRGPALRQAYGLTVRAAPWTPLVFLGEVDLLITSSLGSGGVNTGHADWLQADVEVLQGVHILTAVEGMTPPGGGASSLGLWGGAAWFVFPHFDIRADIIRRSTTGSPATFTYLIQGNGYF
jgi:hypothetical protein